MTILSVAYPLLPVSSDSAGGAEQILFLVERELAAAGHESIVVAAEGSRISGKLIAAPVSNGEITDDIRKEAQHAHLCLIEEALGRYAIDLIHFHGLDFHAYIPRNSVPKLATLHLAPDLYPPWIFDSPDIQLNCVSKTQAVALPEKMLPVVSNGIDIREFEAPRKPKEFLLWLGRICPEKGVHIGLRVAARLDVPMIVAGPVHPFRYHESYFADCVNPLLNEKRRYIGPVDLTTKKKLLAEARCLLIPSLAAETSSLVAMEAISSGTPVIAFRSGALPEIVEDGVTGIIVDSEDGLAEAAGRVDEISAEACRARAKLRFDARGMANGYMNLYAEIIRKSVALSHAR